MRALFLVLILANLAFFAWARYASQPEATDGTAPPGRQIEPEKLKIVAPAETAALAVAPKPAPGTALKCLEWGSFTVADAPRAEKALEPLTLGARLGHRRTEELAAWWVFIPPQDNRPAAQKKAAELKALGVEDYFIVQDEGDYRWALSLGVFRSEDAAQARLAALREKGVRSAQVGPRETVVPKVWLQVKSVDAALEAKLKDIALQVDGSELRLCP
ncbi:MAG TPA: SPOR domain-containing protein [Burkholderiales bacterium]|nr:SPOR domain-containing protein [Burkholderiales bacterium]